MTAAMAKPENCVRVTRTPNPPTAVEIGSRPVPSIETSPAPSLVKETEVLSPVEEVRRHDPLAGSYDALRPSMPIGEQNSARLMADTSQWNGVSAKRWSPAD
jgi:hypothetical protein